MRRITLLLSLALLLVGCGDFTQEVEVNLPVPEPQLVIESYLEPDSAFRVSVTQTQPFFGAVPQVPIIQNATVTITYNDTIVPLTFSPIGNPLNKFVFGEYRSAPGVVVPRNYTTLFRLLVTEPGGKRATAQTTITPPNFRPGQSVLIRHMHISKAYYDFYQSVERAQRGNTNPFQEPGRIVDNVEGGIGIFTGLVVTQRRVTVPQP